MEIPTGHENNLYGEEIIRMLRGDSNIQYHDNAMHELLVFGAGGFFHWIEKLNQKIDGIINLIEIDNCCDCIMTDTEITGYRTDDDQFELNRTDEGYFYIEDWFNYNIITGYFDRENFELYKLNDDFFYRYKIVNEITGDIIHEKDELYTNGLDEIATKYYKEHSAGEEYFGVPVPTITKLDELKCARDHNGNIMYDKESMRITTTLLDMVGHNYGIYRRSKRDKTVIYDKGDYWQWVDEYITTVTTNETLYEEHNCDYFKRILAITTGVSSACGLKRFVASILNLQDDDVQLEYIYSNTTLYETDTHRLLTPNAIDTEDWKSRGTTYGRLSTKFTNININRLYDTISRQLLLKVTIPCEIYDLKDLYDILIDVIPLGVRLEIWDTCGNKYPNIIDIKILLATFNSILPENPVTFTDGIGNVTKHLTDTRGFLKIFDIEGGQVRFTISNRHNFDSSSSTNSADEEYTTKTRKNMNTVLITSDKNNLIATLLIKSLKKNERKIKEWIG